LAAKLQGKTVRRSYFFFSSRVEEAVKLREVVRKSPGKKKRFISIISTSPPFGFPYLRHLFLLNTFAVDKTLYTRKFFFSFELLQTFPPTFDFGSSPW
jgi:hypothetical protein